MDLPVAALNAVPFGIAPALLGAGAIVVALVAGAVRRSRRRAAEGSRVPVLRRADAHPDAPARAPLLATRDLGAPILGDASDGAEQGRPIGKADPLPGDFEPVPELVERALPRDLSQPLAAFDPGAIRRIPLAPPAKLPPVRLRSRAAAAPARLRSPLAEERIARPETDASVHALLDRLERGVIRHGLAIGMETAASASDRRRPDQGLEGALVALRNLARTA